MDHRFQSLGYTVRGSRVAMAVELKHLTENVLTFLELIAPAPQL